MNINIAVLDAEKKIKCEKTLTNRAYLDYLDHYVEGDYIQITLPEKEQYLVVQLDEALNPSLIYLKETTWTFTIPTDEQARVAYPPIAFSGNKHYLTARVAESHDIRAYQNLALNPHDQKRASGAYPHASANVETRDESTFYARNAIDGVIANTNHGAYPYQSWGINQQADALIKIDFGRPVEINQIQLVLRGDYPHDSYWTQATIAFSDGSSEIIGLKKVLDPQVIDLSPKTIEWLVVKDLIKADDDSPFPALTQIEAYGHNL
ncbi:MAG: hypothetical protein ACQER2_05075 [Bacillota bacterium]